MKRFREATSSTTTPRVHFHGCCLVLLLLIFPWRSVAWLTSSSSRTTTSASSSSTTLLPKITNCGDGDGFQRLQISLLTMPSVVVRRGMMAVSSVVRCPTRRKRPSPSMFTNNGGIYDYVLLAAPTKQWRITSTSSRSRSSGGGPTAAATSSDSKSNKYSGRPRRRVLGFDIRSSSSSSSLDATPSNVDLETWKSADVSTTATMHRRWKHPSLDDDDDDYQYHPSSSTSSSASSASLAWIPTRSQIDSLKVVELKLACDERGLPRSGTKAVLQSRLWAWVGDQQDQNQVKITMGDYFLKRQFENYNTDNTTADNTIPSSSTTTTTTTPNSLAEWARNVDLEPLLQKRQEIHRQKREGRQRPVVQQQQQQQQQLPATKEYLKSLARALRAPSSPSFASNNIKVKELYTASKQADQLGERMVAMDLLKTLVMVTPSDARVYRRLARMYTEQGEIDKARETLQAGLKHQHCNPWLWHGLAQLERKHGSSRGRRRQQLLAKDYFEKAIQCDPTFAQAYHALGTMEHSRGNIANATRIIKQGLEYCPTNHRLWHACGGVYRAAQLLDDADRCYRRALQHGPPTSHSFAYSSLAAVAYEQGQLDRARSWLVKSLKVNDGRHAQGWVALAQLEESEGRIQKAQLVCTLAIAQYERGLLEARQRYLRKSGQKLSILPLPLSPNGAAAAAAAKSDDTKLNSVDEIIANQLLQSVPKYRSGDKFVHVYRNWARLEERYGSSYESVDRVYERARIAFPNDYKLLLSWAQYHSKLHNTHKNHHHHERARIIFQDACNIVGNRHADPYRLSAEFEMSLSNFHDARRILFLGARAVMESSRSSNNNNNNNEKKDKGSSNERDNGEKGLAQLLHTWAHCEWNLGNLNRAEVLFDNAWRLVDSGERDNDDDDDDDDTIQHRVHLLYSMARLKQHIGKFYYAQHCIALALRENCARFPGTSNNNNAELWALWAEIAGRTGNEKLEKTCRAEYSMALEKSRTTTTGSRHSNYDDDDDDYYQYSSVMKQPNMEKLLSRDPWQVKLFSNSNVGGGGSDRTTRLKQQWKLFSVETPSIS